ncbi:MAG: class I SAM-dependent methyltransferase [bacterium]|nr:class I SAM-dependent methyltransferase [bacterium]MCP5068901.1 class I SAM-dependent methyltransferase [bacterium]
MNELEGANTRVEALSEGQSSPFLDAWFDLTSADHFWFQWRFRATWRLLADSDVSASMPLRVLEVGCGTGVLLEQLEAATAWTVDGADLDRAALEHVPAGRGRVLFYDLHDRLESMYQAYDLIVLFDVLEHVVDTAPFLSSLLHHLKPGGHLLINVPAEPWLFGRYDEAAGHVRRYDKRSLRDEFRNSSDVTVCDMRYWGLSLVPIVLLRKLVSLWQTQSKAVIERGFQPPGELVHSLLKSMMRVEDALVRNPPLGSSLLLLARKDAPNSMV